MGLSASQNLSTGQAQQEGVNYVLDSVLSDSGNHVSFCFYEFIWRHQDINGV
jgi:hypothetical protein